MVLPIHDVRAPKEIIQPPCAGADGSDLAGASRDKDARGIGVSLSNSPSRKCIPVAAGAVYPVSGILMSPLFAGAAMGAIFGYRGNERLTAKLGKTVAIT